MGVRSYFVYDGKDSRDFNIVVDKSGIYATAERDYDTYEVPGMNGELTFDNGRYRNVEITYQCGIGRTFQRDINYFFAWLMSKRGYFRLEDSLQPEHFRMARVSGVPDPEPHTRYEGGMFEVTFDCKPQKYLKKGEKEYWLSSGALTLENPTYYDAAPLVTVKAGYYGTLTIGSKTIEITDSHATADMIIDFETGDAYSATAHTNWNSKINMMGEVEFPKLKPGTNNIAATGSMASGNNRVSFVPRWWEL